MGQTVTWEDQGAAFLRNARKTLMTPVDPVNHGLFRTVFGILLLVYVWYYRSVDVLQLFYLSSDFHFSFGLFHGLHLPDPTPGLVLAVRQVMAAAAILITAGLFFRPATAIFLLSFGYLFLLEKAVYAHHDYLILLFLILFLVTGPGTFWSADHKLFGKNRPPALPRWTLFLFQAQVSLVYFFSALGKMNGEWLSGQVSATIFAGAGPGFIFAAVIIGLIADVCLSFMLIVPVFRSLGLFFLVALNVAIKYYLDQTILPFLMIGTGALFLQPEHIREMLNLLRDKSRQASFHVPSPDPAAKVPTPTWVFICVYALMQMGIPLRHYLIPGAVQWNLRGDRFSWRFFAQQNVGHIDFFVTDIINGRTVEVPRLAGINAGSYLMMTSRPDMILQYARYLKERYRSQGIYAPLVTVNSFVSTDGRPFALFINPELNVAHSDIGVGHPLFINPAGWDQPGTGVLPQNVGRFFSAPYQLAVIDLEELLPGDHPLVKEMQGMMDILIDEQVISPIQVSNFVVELQQTLYIEYGRSYTTREILQALVDKYGRLGTMPEIKDVLTDFLKPRT